jgi:zinc D-Ala-D-Ala dipeptidase
MLLVEITPPAFDVAIELRYATPDNFTGAPVYRPGGAARAYLRPEAAAALGRAIDLAARLGYRLKLFDAYRPPEAQWALWRHTPDPEFLADPRRGSPHSRGAAVDLTLIDLTGRELEMGTGFDAFTPLSHHGHPGVSPSAFRNRLLLLGLMTDAGWDFYRNEWWHYQLHDARRRFPLIADGAGAERLM